MKCKKLGVNVREFERLMCVEERRFEGFLVFDLGEFTYLVIGIALIRPKL